MSSQTLWRAGETTPTCDLSNNTGISVVTNVTCHVALFLLQACCSSLFIPSENGIVRDQSETSSETPEAWNRKKVGWVLAEIWMNEWMIVWGPMASALCCHALCIFLSGGTEGVCTVGRQGEGCGKVRGSWDQIWQGLQCWQWGVLLFFSLLLWSKACMFSYRGLPCPVGYFSLVCSTSMIVK